MDLDVPEFLVTLIFQYFGEKSYLMVFEKVSLNCLNDRAGPLYDQCFEAVLLVQVGIHELLHRLNPEKALPTFLIVLLLVNEHIVYNLLELLERNDFTRWVILHETVTFVLLRYRYHLVYLLVHLRVV